MSVALAMHGRGRQTPAGHPEKVPAGLALLHSLEKAQKRRRLTGSILD
jgi:hypothetical protein